MENNEILRKIQYVEQDILDYVVEFCEKNSIEYWLDWRTLLGCIRHKGFIPWDDDIDIAMPRNEYNKFIELFKKRKENENFELIDDSMENYNLSFAKIRSLKHFSSENNEKVGIWIDIFPLDYYSNEEISKLETLNLCKQKISDLKRNKKNLINKILLKFFRIKRKKLYKELNKKKNNGKNDILSYALNHEEKIWYFDKKEIYPLIEREFHNIKYKTPNNYDYYLKKEYGQYMVLPKKEDRRIHLKIENSIFDNDDMERIIKKYKGVSL